MKSLSGVAIVLSLFFYFVALFVLVDPEQDFMGYVSDLIVAGLIVYIPIRVISKLKKK